MDYLFSIAFDDVDKCMIVQYSIKNCDKANLSSHN